MTYRELLDALQRVPATMLDNDVTAEIEGEYHALRALVSDDFADVLDANHLYLTTSEED